MAEKTSNSSLLLAVEKDDEVGVENLLKAGANIKVQVKGSPLLYHILDERFENSLGEYYEGYDKYKDISNNSVFKLLLKHGADPNGWSEKGKENILHFAARHGEVNAVHLLIKYGADVNALDDEGETPLGHAVGILKEIVEDIQDYFWNEESDSDDYRNEIFDDSSEEEAHEKEVERKRKEQSEEFERQSKNRKIYNLTHNKYVYNCYQYRRDHEHQDGYSVFKDPDPFRIIAQLLTCQLVKQEVTGKNIVKQNADLLKTEFVKPFYTRCKNEIKKMKKTSVVEGITYYDILVADKSKLEEYASNRKIFVTVKNGSCRKLFPNYARFLKSYLKIGLKRKHPDDDESQGSSDEAEPKGSVQKRPTLKKKRHHNADGCIIS